MKLVDQYSSNEIQQLIDKGCEQSLATTNYPSRGQTAVQKLYQTDIGKLFLKRSNKQNHIDCQINIAHGSLAEREWWAFRLAKQIGLHVPTLWLLDQFTTVQVWLDYPDARQYTTYHGVTHLQPFNVFDCTLFDWLTGQVDRHDANYLYNYVDQEIILIDSAHGFLKYEGSLPDYLRFFEATNDDLLHQSINTPVARAVDILQPQHIHDLVPLRDSEEKAAFERRLQQGWETHCINDLIQLYRGK